MGQFLHNINIIKFQEALLNPFKNGIDGENANHEIFENYIPSKELQLHDYITSSRMFYADKAGYFSKNKLLDRYNLSNKIFGKIKRIDPSLKVIDAYDIDWTGYSIQFRDANFEPKTTFELLDLIFRFISDLYGQIGDDVEWQNIGDNRDEYKFALNWLDVAENEEKIIEIDTKMQQLEQEYDKAMTDSEKIDIQIQIDKQIQLYNEYSDVYSKHGWNAIE